MRRPSSERVSPFLLPPHALLERSSRLLPLLIHGQLVPVPILAHNVDLNVFLDVCVVAATAGNGVDGVAGPGLAAGFHVVHLHHAHYAFFALAERDVCQGVGARVFGRAVVCVVAVGRQALGGACVSVSVGGAHRA